MQCSSLFQPKLYFYMIHTKMLGNSCVLYPFKTPTEIAIKSHQEGKNKYEINFHMARYFVTLFTLMYK